jgi:hypothetical protein
MTRTGAGPAPEQEGRALVERLGGRWTASGGICRCPAHDDRTPSLSVRAGRRRLLLHCYESCASKAAQKWRLHVVFRGGIPPLKPRACLRLRDSNGGIRGLPPLCAETQLEALEGSFPASLISAFAGEVTRGR